MRQNKRRCGQNKIKVSRSCDSLSANAVGEFDLLANSYLYSVKALEPDSSASNYFFTVMPEHKLRRNNLR
jgi:hypothetical protein